MTPSDNDPSSRLEEVRSEVSGLEFFRRMLTGHLPAPPLVALLGLRIVEAEPGRVVFAGTAHESFYNGMGVAHGGWAATLLDSAMGCAINTMMPAGRAFTTLELKINYTRPLTAGIGEVRCEATVIFTGRRTATSEGRIVDRDGKLYAHGTTTCIVVEPRA
jgi:uncharacterized protein (TIGR00369 family)